MAACLLIENLSYFTALPLEIQERMFLKLQKEDNNFVAYE